VAEMRGGIFNRIAGLLLRALGNYIGLLLVSFVLMGMTSLQRVLALLWLLVNSGYWFGAGLARRRPVDVGTAAIGSQFPGLFAAGESIRQLWAIHPTDWGPGFLGLWVHPFLPLLELIPGRTIVGVSDVFLLAMAVPVVLIGWNIGMWYWGCRVARRRTPEFS
jgi:hypothetical protein